MSDDHTRQDAVHVAATAAIRRQLSQSIDRTEFLNMRLTPAERDMIKAMAAKEGVKVSTYTRNVILDVTRHLIEAEGGEAPA